MRLDERITEAMSTVRASDDFTQRVLERVGETRRTARQSRPPAAARRGSAWSLRAVAVAAIIAVMLTGSAAYAVATSDFFQRTWGDHGLGGEVAWNANTGKDAPGLAYRRDMGATLPTETSDELSAAVQEVGISVEGNGYTFTAERIAIDENGCGAVSFVLENDNGIVFGESYGTPGELVFNSEAPGGLDSVFMRIGDGGWASTKCFYGEAAATDTRIEGTMYFDARGSVDALQQGITWQLNWHEGDEDGIETFHAESEPFAPTTVIAARTFVAADGSMATLSPLSLVVHATEPEGSAFWGFAPQSLSVTYADGTTWIVRGGGGNDEAATANTYISTQRDDGSISSVLTQLVDVASASSITMAGSWYTGSDSESVDVVYEYAAL